MAVKEELEVTKKKYEAATTELKTLKRKMIELAEDEDHTDQGFKTGNKGL